jgi:hypothetical protein
VTRQRQCFPESCAAGATLASTQTLPNINAIQYLATRRTDEQDIVVLLTKNEQAGQARAVDLFRPPNDSRFTVANLAHQFGKCAKNSSTIFQVCSGCSSQGMWPHLSMKESVEFLISECASQIFASPARSCRP